MSEIVIATANAHKVEEFRRMIGQRDDIEITSLLDYPGYPGVEENGRTFAENASIKALAAAKYCGLPTFAHDSGLEAAALRGEPAIMSARYADTDAARIAKVLDGLRGKEDRSARFVCVIAIAFNGEVLATFEGTVEGRIADAPRGEGGFGYDPIFIPNGYDQSFAELGADVKNQISHRAKAFAAANEFVEEQLAVLGDLLD
ncbi:MAG: RdgB/HAM1 family non-canonical purine NTP pyrophosphatase [Victivallaceae bacterium]|nr:RdgB/HAM1 family non-canonical purine NTP pyrophosphatase [Victivallaceae bacterium]